MLLSLKNLSMPFKKISWTFFILLISSQLQASNLEVDEILKKVDELYRSKTSFSKMEMIIQTPRWKRTMQMDIWTRGMDYTFVLVNYPKKDKGIATLKREQEMWNFFPKINKVIKVPPSMMMSSWMGSDFTNDDLVKESTLKEDYKSQLIDTENKLNYTIELIPKESVVTVWGKIIVVVDKKSYLPISQDFYDEKGVKVRTIIFKNFQTVNNKQIPMTMELIPLDKEKEGHKTIVNYKEMKFDLEISDSVFTRHNLQKRR